MQILIVDDEPLIRRSLARVIRADHEISVMEAPGMEFAKQIAVVMEANKTPVQVVLTDMEMETRDAGVRLLEWIKKEYPQCRRYLMSGGGDENLIREAVKSGVVEKFFNKPVMVDDLKKIVK